jgi:formylglycine-generating enzyme
MSIVKTLKSVYQVLSLKKGLYFLIGFILVFSNLGLKPFKKFDFYREEIPGTKVVFNMTPIPAGTFIMGTTVQEEGHLEDEYPQRKVKIDAFWMGTHEVTWDIYEMFLDKEYERSISDLLLSEKIDGLTRPSIPYLDMTFGMGKENKPAIAMTQYNAIQFCKWLYFKTGHFYRLPTEAEWEYAARGGSETTYFFGIDKKLLNEYAVYKENSKGSTMEVGSKKPNPFGLYDILGNVMEWTIDTYSSYNSMKKTLSNPVANSNNLYPHVLRGGHFQSSSEDLRCGKRFASTPIWKQLDPQIPKSKWWFPEAPFVGMRLVRPLITPSIDEIMAYYNQPVNSDY